jgi:hypothetical protein
MLIVWILLAFGIGYFTAHFNLLQPIYSQILLLPTVLITKNYLLLLVGFTFVFFGLTWPFHKLALKEAQDYKSVTFVKTSAREQLKRRGSF